MGLINSFLIMVAPVLVLATCIITVFVWATKAKPPAFVLEEMEKTKEHIDETDENKNTVSF